MFDSLSLDAEIRRYEGYLETDPLNAALCRDLAVRYQRGGRYNEAIKMFTMCIKIDPAMLSAKSELAIVQIQIGDYEGAENNLLQVAREKNLADPGILHNLGVSHYLRNQWEAARDYFYLAINSGNADSATYGFLSRTFHYMGELDLALENCKTWRKLTRSTDSHAYEALLTLEQSNIPRAAQLASEALSVEPTHPLANTVAGLTKLEMNDIDGAYDFLRSAVSHDPVNDRAWLGIGMVYLRRNDHSSAINSLEQSILSRPSNLGAIVALGWTVLATKDFVRAESIFRHAIEVDGTFAECHGGLASSLAMQGRFAEADVSIAIASRLNSNSFGKEFAVSIKLEAAGQGDLAKKFIARALRRTVGNGPAELIDLLKNTGALRSSSATAEKSESPSL